MSYHVANEIKILDIFLPAERLICLCRPTKKKCLVLYSTWASVVIPPDNINSFPGHTLHENGLQRHQGIGPMVTSQEQRALVVPRKHRIEGQSQSSDRFSSWKIGLEIDPQDTQTGLVRAGRKKKKKVLRSSGRKGWKKGILRSSSFENRKWDIFRSSEPENRRTPHPHLRSSEPEDRTIPTFVLRGRKSKNLPLMNIKKWIDAPELELDVTYENAELEIY